MYVRKQNKHIFRGQVGLQDSKNQYLFNISFKQDSGPAVYNTVTLDN